MDPILELAASKDTTPGLKEERAYRMSIIAAATKHHSHRKCSSRSGSHSMKYCCELKSLAPRKRTQLLDAYLVCLTVGHEIVLIVQKRTTASADQNETEGKPRASAYTSIAYFSPHSTAELPQGHTRSTTEEIVNA
ncbi:hypothetical protein KM043_016496 [Ampulex compressa]|nr:hypothetical protein KM043_016496 [Ampulex compressa]